MIFKATARGTAEKNNRLFLFRAIAVLNFRMTDGGGRAGVA
jgi:hypothetical protein